MLLKKYSFGVFQSVSRLLLLSMGSFWTFSKALTSRSPEGNLLSLSSKCSITYDGWSDHALSYIVQPPE